MAFRFDLVTGNWVLLASSRRGLPVATQLVPSTNQPDARACPFCPGHESETEETLEARTDASGRWRVRVVRNRFPAVSLQPPVAVAGTLERPALGDHELVIETPVHDADLGDLDDAHRTEVLAVYRHRVQVLASRAGVEFVSVFRNRGRRAGSSQPHPHGQIVATELVPPSVEFRQRRAREHHRTQRQAPVETLRDQALAEKSRLVLDAGAFTAFAPFAPHRSYEVWIVPQRRTPSFAAVRDDDLTTLARALGEVLRRLATVTHRADYNLVFREPPVADRDQPWSAWWVEVLPRTGGDAGYELSTEIDVVPTAPELAAEQLRAVP